MYAIAKVTRAPEGPAMLGLGGQHMTDLVDRHTPGLVVLATQVQAVPNMRARAARLIPVQVGLSTMVLAALPMMAPAVQHTVALAAPAMPDLEGRVTRDQEVMPGIALRYVNELS